MENDRFYPTDERGLAIPVHELDLPESRIPDELLDEGEPYVNMHHNYWEKVAWIGNAVCHKFRQLEINITPLPIDTHRALHQRYKGIRIPAYTTLYEVIQEQYETGGLIYPRHATKNPRPISEEDMREVRKDYNRLLRYGK